LKALKLLRLQQNMTQAELAQKMGVTQSLIAMWEREASMPSASKLPELADLLHCTIDELYGRGRDSA
jgi:transcriptional regulator with XRE-family HTH domain